MQFLEDIIRFRLKDLANVKEKFILEIDYDNVKVEKFEIGEFELTEIEDLKSENKELYESKKELEERIFELEQLLGDNNIDYW